MRVHRVLAVSVWLMALGAASAQPLPVLDDKPTPQIDAGGPAAAITCLTFGPDGETFYSASLDKVVRAWKLQNGRFILKQEYRVPIGPDNAGAVNSIAVSADGKWLAMAGRAPIRGEAGFRQGGVVVESTALSAEQRMDAGVIYVANTTNPAGGKILRGHRGGVRSMAFLPAREGKAPLLVSAAIERDEGQKPAGRVRLWDVASGKMLGAVSDLPATETPPALAAWHTGKEPRQVRVAIAWPERDIKTPSYLRLWDPSNEEKPLHGWANDPLTSTAALLAQGNGVRLLTGGLANRGNAFGPGRLQTWNLSADREPNASFGAQVAFPPRGGAEFLPVALASLPGYAAVVLRPSDRGKEDRLALVELNGNRTVADFEIANSDNSQLPTLAAGRKFIAIADTRDHAIHVHSLDDLLAGKSEPIQVLHADSLTPSRVAFVNRGHALRLTLAGQARDVIFDLDKSQIQGDDGTAADDTERGEQPPRIAENGKVVRFPRRDGEPVSVRLRGALEVATAAAARPGVLAVAFTDYAAFRTHIMLCDPATGKPFRLLVSHLQEVRSLAFSKSRPLLASVADDQTVCVWSLADMDRAVGQLSGLEASDDRGQVVVRAVAPDSAAARAGLAAGDVLESAGAPGVQLQPIKNAASFLLAVAARKPGSQVEIAVNGKGKLRLTVDRGIDERKPLFSLMFLKAANQPDWIGWSPAGPYDFGSPTAEARLGWHTNTGDPAAPVSFVDARTYGKKYFRQGILRHLASEADLSRALEKWDAEHPKVMPRPALHFRKPDAALATDSADEFLIRGPVDALALGINGDFRLEDSHSVRYQISRADNGKLHNGEAVLRGQARRDGSYWKLSLSGVEWRRGIYRLEAELISQADGPVLAKKSATFRYQPPAPAVSFRQDGKAILSSESVPLKVMTEKLPLEIVMQAPASQELVVTFLHLRNGSLQNDVPAKLTRRGGGNIKQEFKLNEGLNHLLVQTVNQGALAGHEDDETAIDDVWITYNPPRELPPRFAKLEMASDADLKRVDGKAVWIVSHPTADLKGKIEASGVLVRAGWSGGKTEQSVLPPAESRGVEFTAKLDGLPVGEVSKLRFWAKSKFSDENVAERFVVYYPPLPTYTLDPLANADVFTDKIRLTGSVQTATPDPFEISIRVISPKGEVRLSKADLDRKAGKWKAELTLYPGGNTIETVASNKWRRETSVGNLVAVNFRRPPRIVAVPEKLEAKEAKKLRVDLKVEGPAGLPLREIQVNDTRVEYLVHELAKKDDQWTWNVEIPEVFVNDGNRDLTEIRIRAITDDGPSPAAVVRVTHTREAQLPTARILTPAVQATSRHPKFPIAYRLESKKPLERARITGGKSPVDIDLKNAAKENDRFVVQGEAAVALNNGLNNLELTAVNSDGRSPAAKVVISYVEPAVLILPEKIELRSAKNELEGVLEPSFGPNGDVLFRQPADRSLVGLTGAVRWSDPQAEALDDPNLKVVVSVRDCRQFPVSLEPRGKGDDSRTRRFRVPLVLIGDENLIRIEIPTVGQQRSSHREFKIACSNPIRRQRLHLLIVGVRVRDAEKLKKRVLNSLSVDPKDQPAQLQGEFVKNPPFERCILYRVLAGEVSRGDVDAQLERINDEIKRSQQGREPLNDVVLIYYQGEDVVVPGTKERWLKTSQNFKHVHTPVQEEGISCQALLREAGAQLLMVNVAGAYDPRLAGPDWGGDTAMGFMRYAYPDPIEVSDPNPPLLGMLSEATRRKSRLGEVVDYVNGAFVRQLATLRPLTILDDDQKSRRISEPVAGNQP